MTTPVLVVVAPVSRRAAGLAPSRNSFLPEPRWTGKVQQAVLVDEVVLDEGMSERAAAVNLEFVAWLFLELGDLGGDVAAAAEQPGVVPVH